MDPSSESTKVSKNGSPDDGLGEHTGDTPATSAVDDLPGQFGDLGHPKDV